MGTSDDMDRWGRFSVDEINHAIDQYKRVRKWVMISVILSLALAAVVGYILVTI